VRGIRRLQHVMHSLAVIGLTVTGLNAQADDEYLKWPPQRAEAIGKAAYQRGRVGGVFDTRFLKTKRSYNYKLAATWLTPETIRATARMTQLQSRLSDAETTQLVAEAEATDRTVVMVEIAPGRGRESFRSTGRRFSSRRISPRMLCEECSVRNCGMSRPSPVFCDATTLTTGSGSPSR